MRREISSSFGDTYLLFARSVSIGSQTLKYTPSAFGSTMHVLFLRSSGDGGH